MTPKENSWFFNACCIKSTVVDVRCQLQPAMQRSTRIIILIRGVMPLNISKCGDIDDHESRVSLGTAKLDSKSEEPPCNFWSQFPLLSRIP